MSVDTPENAEFIEKWHGFIGSEDRVTNDPMEAHYIGFNMWVKAVEAAGTTDPDAVIAAMDGVAVPNLTGGLSSMSSNHHITKPVLIGEIRDDGQFDVVWETTGLVLGDEWSDYLPEIGGSDRQLARADVLRQLQRRDRRVRRRHQLNAATRARGTDPAPGRISGEAHATHRARPLSGSPLAALPSRGRRRSRS